MAELIFYAGTMDCGKSTLALQTDHNHSSRGRAGVVFTRLDRAGESVLSSRLGLEVPAVEVDEELLQQIASRTGGRFFKATSESALREIFGEIDALEKTPIATKTYVRYEEAFQPLLWSALALLLLPLATGAANWTVEP